VRRALLVATLLIFCGSGALAAQAGVSGTVVDASTGVPLEGVWVGTDTTEAGVLTGPEGKFVHDGLGAIGDTLLIRRIGYATARVPASDGMRVELVPMGVRLDGIDVSAEASEVRSRVRRAQSTSLLDAETIDRVQGQTLGGTIESVPGVSVIQYGPSISKPVVRGLHSQRVVVSNDGVRQEGQQWGGEHAPEIDVFGADQIEIVRGPGAVEYGSDAMGGVVRVEPSRLGRTAGWSGELATHAFANNQQGAASLGLENGALDLPLLGTVSSRFRVTGRRAGDATAPGFNLDNTGFSEFSLSGSIGWIGDRRRTELTVSRYDTQLGLFSGAHVGNFEDLQRVIERGPRPSEFAYEIDNPRQQVTHDRVLLRYRSLLADDRELDVSYAFQLNRRREFDNHGRLANRDEPAFGLDLYTHSLEGAYGIDHGSGTTRFGVSGMRQGNISIGRGYLIPQYRLYTSGAWVRDERSFGSVTLNAGVRGDYRWQRTFPPPDRGLDLERTTDSWADVSGGVGVTWEFSDGWFVGSYVGRAWRAANVNERFSQGVHHGTAQYELGDATLDKESTTNVDATLRRTGERFRLQLNAFRNVIDGYIFLRPREPVLTIRGAYPAFEYRQADAFLSGLELDLDVEVGAGVALFGQGSLIRGENRELDEPLYDMPADRLRTGVRWAPAARGFDGFSAEVSALLVREQDRVPAETIYGLPTEGYQLVDVGLSWTALEVTGRSFDVSLDVTNLFDRAYRDYLSRYRLFVEDPGRDVVLRVRMPLGG